MLGLILGIMALLGTLLLLAVAVVVLTTAARVYRPRIQNGKPSFAVDEVEFTTQDGLTLRGWWVEGRKSMPVVVMCHGVGFNRFDLEPLAARLHAAGVNLLLFDFRGHGQSDGNKTSYGMNERYDVIAAVRFLKQQGYLDDRRLCFYALSMGGAALIMAAAELKTITPITAVVLDSTFARFKPLVEISVKEWLPPLRWLFVLLARPIGRRLFHLPAHRIQPVEQITDLDGCRLLVIHSEEDEGIPVEHGRELFERASEPKEFWQLSDCAHGESFLHEGENFSKRLTQFFTKS